MMLKSHSLLNWRIFFKISYPLREEFDIIGRAIVVFLKLPLTNENVVSLFNICNKDYPFFK